MAYDQMLPGLAERMVRLTEETAAFQRDVVQTVEVAEVELRRRGQAIASGLAALAFIAAMVFFAVGNDVAGVAFLSMPVTALVAAFLRSG